ncbi:MAG TPA: penicillin acylase family protein [Candidatus Limnocylindrales bacterium]
MRVLRRVLAGLLAVVLVVVVAFGGLVAWVSARATPQVQGSLHVPGLQGSVTVLRDAAGIAQLYADSPHDLFLAQGYVHAQERMWQMELWRHISSGRLAELFGADEVKTDRFIRTLGWRQAAERDLAAASPDAKAALQAYADGVNDWLTANQSHLGLAFVVSGVLSGQAGGLGGYQPEPWTAVDSLAWAKVEAWSLGGDYSAELFRQLADQRLGRQATDELFPAYGADRPVIMDAAKPDGGASRGQPNPAASPSASPSPTPGPSASPSPTPSAGPSQSPGSSASPTASTTAHVDAEWSAWRDLAATSQHVLALAGLDGASGGIGSHGVGSNDWVVAPSKSATGHALLANDPHLGVSMPSVWIMDGLHCRTPSPACPLDVVGVSFPGVPGVILGHNARIAWGATNVGPDVQDLYVEKPDPTDASHYLFEDRSLPFTVRREEIRVAGQQTPVTLDVRETIHGPILNGAEERLRGSTTLYSLKWTATAEPDHIVEAFLGLDTAGDFAAFKAALAHLGAPSQNFVYADVDGHIGYQVPGYIPVRQDPGDHGDRPVPGWDGQHEWTGRIPYEALPSLYDPPSGVIVTANNEVADGTYDHYLGDLWDPGYRAARILQLLRDAAAHGGVSQTAMSAIQMDTRLLRADAVVADLATLDPRPASADGRTVLARIRSWDRTCGTDSQGCAAFEVFEYRLERRLFDARLGTALARDYVGTEPSREALRALLQQTESAWWDDPGTPTRETATDTVAAALDAAGADLRGLLGDDVRWTWGRIHTVSFAEGSLGSGGLGPLAWYFDVGPYAAPGTSMTVDNTSMDWTVAYPDPNDPKVKPATDLRQVFAVTVAPSYRLDVDMGDLDAARIVTTTGQGGNPFGPHYGDLARDWLDGRQEPLWFSHDTVAAHAVATLTLLPPT